MCVTPFATADVLHVQTYYDSAPKSLRENAKMYMGSNRLANGRGKA